MRGKGEGSVFKDARGLWTGTIELPPLDGSRRRKTVRSKSKKVVVDKLNALRAELKERGDLPTHDQTVSQWFTYWLREIVTKEVRPNTANNYSTVVTKYIIPTIGTVKLEKVNATHIRRVTDAMTTATATRKAMSSTYALNAHRIMSASFEVARREGRIGRNPAKLTRAPRKAVANLGVLSLEQGLQVLESAANDPLAARWAVAMLTGARRGEVLGLEADRVGDIIDLSWQLQRFPTGARGTIGSVGKPIVPADFEYRHVTGGLYLTRPKSDAGRRVIPMFDPLRQILERHMELYPPVDGFVFTVDGRPIDPGQDSKNWRTVLKASGVDEDVRLHDLRHTAVDFLYLAEVPEDIIVQIVGHSKQSMTRSYQSRNLERNRAALQKMGALFMTPSPDTRPAIDA